MGLDKGDCPIVVVKNLLFCLCVLAVTPPSVNFFSWRGYSLDTHTHTREREKEIKETPISRVASLCKR